MTTHPIGLHGTRDVETGLLVIAGMVRLGDVSMTTYRGLRIVKGQLAAMGVVPVERKDLPGRGLWISKADAATYLSKHPRRERNV